MQNKPEASVQVMLYTSAINQIIINWHTVKMALSFLSNVGFLGSMVAPGGTADNLSLEKFMSLTVIDTNTHLCSCSAETLAFFFFPSINL